MWQLTSEGIGLTEPGTLGSGMRQGVRHGREARAPRGSPGARLGSMSAYTVARLTRSFAATSAGVSHSRSACSGRPLTPLSVRSFRSDFAVVAARSGAIWVSVADPAAVRGAAESMVCACVLSGATGEVAGSVVRNQGVGGSNARTIRANSTRPRRHPRNTPFSQALSPRTGFPATTGARGRKQLG